MQPKEFCARLDALIEKNRHDWRGFEARIIEKYATEIGIENIQQFGDVDVKKMDDYVEQNWNRISKRTLLEKIGVGNLIIQYFAALHMKEFDEETYYESIYGAIEPLQFAGFSDEKILDFVTSVSVL